MAESRADRSLNALTRDVIGAAIHVHKELGPGLLEKVYVESLEQALEDRGFEVGREVVVPATFEGRQLDAHYRLDLVVEDRVVVEVKACRELAPVHRAQLLTYLRATELPVGLLMNFHTAKLVEGLRRVIE